MAQSIIRGGASAQQAKAVDSATKFGRGVRQVHQPRLWVGTGPGSEPNRESWSSHGVSIYCGDAIDRYSSWEPPTAIISDGAYGVKGFPGDPPTPDGLAEWYRPHIEAWSRFATPETTLWFWNTDLGWATVHPILVANGWMFRSPHVWDKGMAHAAGNSNTQTLRRLPVVTEVCQQYVREGRLPSAGIDLPIKDWLRAEWARTGLTFAETNRAAGVLNAATRKYFTKDHLWYFPPAEVFARLAEYANAHGDPRGRPYFSRDGRRSMSEEEWTRMRAKFHCELGITNVWREPPLHGEERVKIGAKCVHLNQKPLKLLDRIIRISTDENDVVWDPFAGLGSVGIAALGARRRCRSAELNKAYYRLAVERLAGAVTRGTPV